jgi:hypothetical protein
VFIGVYLWFDFPLHMLAMKKNRGERSIPGCGAGMESLCRVS